MIHHSRVHRSFSIAIVIAAFSYPAIFSSNQAAASITFNFEQGGSGIVLAVLELSVLPASSTDVSSLTFTAAGDAIFGLGAGVYSGSFVAPGGDSVVAEGPSGLMGTDVDGFAFFTDFSAPVSSIFGGGASFEMGFATGPDPDYLSIFLEGEEGEFREGNWRLAEIPEPSTLLIWSSLGLTSLVGIRRRRIG